jgi:DHA2 family multidrug resistance protein-like MFS transporter
MSTDVGKRAGRREWLSLAVLTLPLLVLALDVSVLFLAAPHLQADLRPSGTELLWIMDAYGFLIAGFLVTMGALGDRIGRRRLLMIGGIAFALASLLAAYAPSSTLLIAARALLGVAGATLMPSTLALITNIFTDPRQRATAIAIWMTAFSAGTAAGPIVGGLMLQAFWWGSVFLLAVPVMVLLVVLGPILLPEYRDPDPSPTDLVSVAMSLATVLPVVYGLKEIATGHGSWLPAVALGIGVVMGALFVRRQRRIDAPLVDVRLFRNRSFTVALALLLLGIAAINGVNFLYPQFLQLVQGLSPVRAGLWLIPIAVAAVAGGMLAPVATRWVRPAHVIAAGAALSVVGFALITQVRPATGIGFLLVAGMITVFGLSPMGVLTTDMVVGSAPAEKAGSAAALSETSGELGVGLGVALMGTVATAVYRAQLDGTVPATVRGARQRRRGGRSAPGGAARPAGRAGPRGLHRRAQRRGRARRCAAGRARRRRGDAGAPTPLTLTRRRRGRRAGGPRRASRCPPPRPR